jgi:hypothetical protein
VIILIILIIAGIVVAGIWHLAASKPASRVASARETPAEQAHRTERAHAQERARQEQARHDRARQEEQARRREEALRQEQRRLEAEALHADLVALEEAARKPPAASPAAPVLAAGLRLAVQDRAIETVGEQLRDPIPQVRPDDGDDPARATRSFIEALDRRSVAVAGVEQLVLVGFGTGRSAADADAALLALAGLPATVVATKDALGAHLQDPQFVDSMVVALRSTLDHARTTLLPYVDGGPHLGLFLETAVAAIGQGWMGALKTGTKWGGKEILHGLNDLLGQVTQTEEVARTLTAAVAQLEETGEAIFDLLDVDGVFGGVPIGTIVISLTRETLLFRAGQTSSGAAVRNLVLDVTGAAVGGAVGLTVGGLIGSLVAPGPGSAVGVTVGVPAGAATGRKIANKVKMRRVRRARDELARVEEALPGRVQEADHRLAEAVAGQAAVSREAYRAAADPPPRLDVGRGSPVAAVATALRNATTAYLREVDAAIARAKDAAAGGYIPSPAVAATTARLEVARRAVAATAGAAPLRALCALAEAAPPVPAGRRLGSGYRTATLAAANRLGEVAGVHAAQARTWVGQTSAGFAAEAEHFGAAIAPDLATHRERMGAIVAEREAAGAKVVRELEQLGKAAA